MKKSYKKPEIYSEKLAFDTLRAQTCQTQDNSPPMPFSPEFGDFCASTCEIFENSPSV